MDLVTLVLACSLYTDNSIPYAMIQTGSRNNPLVVSVEGDTRSFKTISAAIRYTHRQISLGKNPEIGLMQIPNRWLSEVDAHVSDLFRPCKNVVVGTQILEKLRLQCQSFAAQNPKVTVPSCVLSRYKTKNPQNGFSYAYPIIRYAQSHPFNALVEKARDPGMLAAEKKPPFNHYAKQTENKPSEDPF
ncbi:hypothetical protein BEV13_06335 [Rickettsiella grylli]|uniref:transglycosylase SLT domain-containing protein n=1 Tax=Rickettsiella grylli TaxID=59196 RepID=UPI0008FD4552|nr:transglycosylase SLT domain-containing protein [Rickettsiella grylli]OIZ99045.1 hypothetical protein BEV13_06335 [Rickettsiella grylli]